MKQKRIENVISKMKSEGISQMIISDPSSIFYFTGKWILPGERMLVLLLNADGSHKFFINELFPIHEDLGVQIVSINDNDDAAGILSKYIENGKTIGIDKNWPSHFLLRLMELKNDCRFVNGSLVIDDIRSRKDKEERNLMRNASRVNDTVMDKLIKSINGTKSEEEVAESLLKVYKDEGATGFSFEPIIGYGKNGADPHHENDNSMLKEGDSIIMDIGGRNDSYCSDMTRTVFYKKVSDKEKEVYNITLEANKRGIAAVKPGARFCDIDKAARGYIESKGYGKYFTHRLGHSIGIDTHEFGDVSSVNTNIVHEGMIFSIEPGIYIPGEFGVRIEDLVLVTKDGCEVLNKFSKDLKVIK